VQSLPTVRRSTIGTQAVVFERESLLIGGFNSERTVKQNDAVPGLGNLPIFGALFRKDTSSVSRSERLFLITPRILSGDENVLRGARQTVSRSAAAALTGTATPPLSSTAEPGRSAAPVRGFPAPTSGAVSARTPPLATESDAGNAAAPIATSTPAGSLAAASALRSAPPPLAPALTPVSVPAPVQKARPGAETATSAMPLAPADARSFAVPQPAAESRPVSRLQNAPSLVLFPQPRGGMDAAPGQETPLAVPASSPRADWVAPTATAVPSARNVSTAPSAWTAPAAPPPVPAAPTTSAASTVPTATLAPEDALYPTMLPTAPARFPGSGSNSARPSANTTRADTARPERQQ
jgi:hypothetical protein